MYATTWGNAGVETMAKVKIAEFLNTAEELHALVVGLCEIVAPFPPPKRLCAEERATETGKEWHYYQLGRALGVFVWLLILAIIKRIFL